MRILETWKISLISHQVENYDSPRASAWKKDKNLELKKMPTKHFENETFQIFRKIVDVDTCQESDISLKTSVAYRLVNSDPRGPNRTYYVSLLNIWKYFFSFEIQFSVIEIEKVRRSPSQSADAWSNFGPKTFIKGCNRSNSVHFVILE